MRHDNADVAAGFAPSWSAHPDGAFARFAGFAEDRQAPDAIDHREETDRTDAAECPCRREAKLMRRHARFDAFTDGDLVSNRIKLHGGTVHASEHAPVELAAVR